MPKLPSTKEKKIEVVRVMPWEENGKKGWVIRRDYSNGTQDFVTNKEYEQS